MTPPPAPTAAASTTSRVPRNPTAADAADRAAIARYDYLMQTADPHQIERIHQDAFAKLTPAQRTQVEARMRAELPTYEQPVSASPRDLARATARSEATQPGRMRGLLARGGSSAALAGAGVAAGGLLGRRRGRRRGQCRSVPPPRSGCRLRRGLRRGRAGNRSGCAHGRRHRRPRVGGRPALRRRRAGVRIRRRSRQSSASRGSATSSGAEERGLRTIINSVRLEV